jgi:DNA-binding NarL/FixJ family response regulator
MTHHRLRVVIADDQALVRAGFKMILESQPDIEVVAEAADGYEAVEACRRLRPDVILMDVRMPNLNGIEGTKRIAALGEPATRVLILTTFDLDEYVYAALRSGAGGFLLKDVRPEQLINAVRQVVAGDALLAPSITRRLVERFARPTAGPPVDDSAVRSLTPRELEVLKLVARGLKNSEIAQVLFLSESTVKTHMARVLSKLGLRDRAQAVVVAYESGVVGVARAERDSPPAQS